MKNFKKVLNELKSVSSNFYVGGSLSLYVFHYITRTPKDLDIQSNDPIFLEMAKEMEELSPVPVENRGGRVKERFSPDTRIAAEPWFKERITAQCYASFVLHGIKVEVFKNTVEKYYLVHGYNFINPNEVLFYKNQYLHLRRLKDIQDVTESYIALYPERIIKGNETNNFLLGDWNFKLKDGKYAGNNLPTHTVDKVLSDVLKPRQFTGFGKDIKVVRKKHLEFLAIFNAPKEKVEMPDINRYLTKEVQKMSESTFKLYGYSKHLPSVTVHKKYIIIKDEYYKKLSLSKDAFQVLVETGLQQKGSVMFKTFKLCGSNHKSPIVGFYPRNVYITDIQGRKVPLPWAAFNMLKDIKYA